MIVRLALEGWYFAETAIVSFPKPKILPRGEEIRLRQRAPLWHNSWFLDCAFLKNSGSRSRTSRGNYEFAYSLPDGFFDLALIESAFRWGGSGWYFNGFPWIIVPAENPLSWVLLILSMLVSISEGRAAFGLSASTFSWPGRWWPKTRPARLVTERWKKFRRVRIFGRG